MIIKFLKNHLILENSYFYLFLKLQNRFPKIVMFNGKKNGFSVMNEEFDYKNIGNFLKAVFSDSDVAV